jgi:cytoskeletal protein CcmA (bactofilin family)
MTVTGNLTVSGTTTTVETLTVQQDATVTNDLTVNGDSKLGNAAATDTTTIYGTTTWYNADPTPAPTAVITYTGNISTPGTLDVDGSCSLAATGVATTVRGTLTVNETSTLSGNVSCGANLSVTGTTTLSGLLDLNNNAEIGGTLTLDATTSTLIVGADDANNNYATIHGDLTVGTATNARNLSVSGTSTLTGNVSTSGTLSVGSTSTLTGAVSCGSTLSVTGAATFSSTVDIDGNTTITGELSLDAPGSKLTIGADDANNNTLTVYGDLVIGSATNPRNLTVSGTQTFTGGTTFAGSTTFGDSSTDTALFYATLKVNDNQPTPKDTFVVDPLTGNTTVSGTFDAAGNTTIGGTLAVSGNADFSAGVDVTGGNLTVGGTNFIVDVTTGNITTAGTIKGLANTQQIDTSAANYATLSQGQLTGAINGTNTTFTTSANFEPGTLIVWVNGQNVNSDIASITANSFTLNTAPLAGAVVECAYTKAIT